MIQLSNNKITLCGTVSREPELSHEVFGEKFYSLVLNVKRLSGQFDELPIIISERLIESPGLLSGKRVLVEGQLRSYNMMTDGTKSRLQLQTFVRNISEADSEEDINIIELDGFICKEPIYRVTPFSREISDILLAVNRSYGKSDYIPIICWGRNARYSQQLAVGDNIVVEGRLQSREYQKKIDEDTTVTKTAYEVSVSKLTIKNKDEE